MTIQVLFSDLKYSTVLIEMRNKESILITKNVSVIKVAFQHMRQPIQLTQISIIS